MHMPATDQTSTETDLMDAARACRPITMAVVHPCDAAALGGALAARDEGLIEPILVGPENRIRAVAEQENLSLGDARIEAVPHSHAAAARAVELIHGARAEALMKGSLHTDELMAEVVAKDGGLRTARRVSHVFVMKVPAYPRLLLITDAAINIEPTLEEKADIVQNAIDLAHVLKIASTAGVG